MSFRRRNDYAVRPDSLSRLRDRHHEIDGDSTYQIPTRSRRDLSPAQGRLQLTGGVKINNPTESRDYDWGFCIDRNSNEHVRSRSPQFGLVKTKLQVEGSYMNEESYNDIRGLDPDYLQDDTRTTRETFFHDSKLRDSSQYRMLSEELLIRQPIDILSNHGERGEIYAPSKESSETRYYPEKRRVDRSLDMEAHKESDNLVTYSSDASYYPNVASSKANVGGSFRYKDLEGTSSSTLRFNLSSSYLNDEPSGEDEYSKDPDKVVGGLSSSSYGLNRQSYFSDLGCDSDITHKYLGGSKWDINVSPVSREGRGYLNTRNVREIDELGYPSDKFRRVGSEDRVDHKQDDFFKPGIRGTAITHFDTREESYGYPRSDARGYPRSDAREHSSTKKQVDSVYCPGVSKSKAVSEIGKEFEDLDSSYSQHDRRIWRGHEVLHSGIIYDHDISPSWQSQYRFGRESNSSSHVESRRELTSGFGFGRDAGPDYNSERVREFRSDVDVDSYTDRIRELPDVNYEDEMDVLSVSQSKYQWENAAKEDISERRLRSKYLGDQQINRINSRKAILSDINDVYNRNDEWNDEDFDIQIPSRRLYDKNKPFQRKKRVFDRLVECGEVITHKDVLSSNDLLQNRSGIQSRLGNEPSKDPSWLGSLDHINRKPARPDNVWIKGKEFNGRRPGVVKEKEDNGIHSRLGDGPSKGLPWLGSLGHVSKKMKPSKPSNLWMKEEDNGGGAGPIDNEEPDKSERLVTSIKKTEPHEDSEEFKKLVHKAFLSFSKKLNENPSDQRSYKEQGRVGRLFCIVCGKSKSKEFMGTKQLAIHAFTSDKVGLRAQHLGFHKAICVLLGWQSLVVAPDVNWYIPEPVSEEESLAQKEDLILWPPVVIVHTTSVSQDNAKLNIVDAVTEFLKGKGIGGNFKASLGRSAANQNQNQNQSTVVLLKYLGIFSNLQNAERIHKYFLGNKRGRADFDKRVASNKCSNTISSRNDDDKSGSCKEEEDGRKGSGGEENSFYGYMGISEDLEVLDLETMNKCLIKSKKEVQDLVNAPFVPRN